MILGIRSFAKRIARALAVLMASFALAGGARAADEDAFADWNLSYQEAIRKLEAGETVRALELLDGVLEQYAWRSGPGEANERNLGAILVHRAVALQQAGRIEDANWDWDVATAFLPQAERFDLRRFGAAGEALMAHVREASRREQNPDLNAPRPPAGQKFKPPKVVRRVAPEYPAGALYYHSRGRVEVQVVVDEEGLVSQPRFLRKVEHPGLNYAAIEALRRWKLNPATVDGRPVKVYFSLTVQFRENLDGSPSRYRSPRGRP